MRRRGDGETGGLGSVKRGFHALDSTADNVQLRGPMDRSKLEERLKVYFAARDEVVAAYLFGSRAQDRQRPGSDLDLAVLLVHRQAANAFEYKDQYMIDLGRMLRLDIHPVIMNAAGEELLRQVFARGKCVQVNDQRACDLFRISAYCRIADFDRYRKMAQRGFLDRLRREAAGD